MKNNNIGCTSKKVFNNVIIAVILLFIMLSSCDKDSKNASPGANMSGSWKIQETINGNCGGKDYPYNKMDIAAIEQINNNLTIVYSSLGTNFTGTLIGNTISFSGDFEEGDGTNTIVFSGTLSADGNTFTGNASWTWSDDESTCSGTAQVTGEKVVQIITDIEGQWAGNWESDDSYSDGTFSVNINQSNNNLSGSINIPSLGMNNDGLSGTFSGNSILFGDIGNEIVFYGVVDSDSTLIGRYTYYSLDDEGTWNATRVNSD